MSLNLRTSCQDVETAEGYDRKRFGRFEGWLGQGELSPCPVTSRGLEGELRQLGLWEIQRLWTIPVVPAQTIDGEQI